MQLTEGDDVVITDASQPNRLRVSFFVFLCIIPQNTDRFIDSC